MFASTGIASQLLHRKGAPSTQFDWDEFKFLKQGGGAFNEKQRVRIDDIAGSDYRTNINMTRLCDIYFDEKSS